MFKKTNTIISGPGKFTLPSQGKSSNSKSPHSFTRLVRVRSLFEPRLAKKSPSFFSPDWVGFFFIIIIFFSLSLSRSTDGSLELYPKSISDQKWISPHIFQRDQRSTRIKAKGSATLPRQSPSKGEREFPRIPTEFISKKRVRTRFVANQRSGRSYGSRKKRTRKGRGGGGKRPPRLCSTQKEN